ncbi:MAG: hypothetical protein IT349_09195 [Candidatus Eisenbacteria bacterium]|nr:hypothetical protein [Candidatus Eisenbacteria bacterium]
MQELREHASDATARAEAEAFAQSVRTLSRALSEISELLAQRSSAGAFVQRRANWIERYVSDHSYAANTALIRLGKIKHRTDGDARLELELMILALETANGPGAVLEAVGFPYRQVAQEAERIGFYSFPPPAGELAGPEYQELLEAE